MTPHALGGQVSVEEMGNGRINIIWSQDDMDYTGFSLDHEQLANLVQWAKARGLIE